MNELPDNVIGFEADGEIHAEDYRNTLIPAIEQQIDAQGEARVVLVFPDSAGYSGGAMWQDLKLGAGHLTKWHRIAVVSDLDWMTHLVNAFGWMIHGDVKHFHLAERQDAITWAAG